MRAYFYEYGIWTGTDSLWHGLGLEGRMEQARSVKGPGPFVFLQETTSNENKRLGGDAHSAPEENSC